MRGRFPYAVSCVARIIAKKNPLCPSRIGVGLNAKHLRTLLERSERRELLRLQDCGMSSEGGECSLKRLGKCPACEQHLSDRDVEEIQFKGTVGSHFAYRCSKCDTIVGFSSFWRA